MSTRFFRNRRNQASLNAPVISSPSYGSTYPYGSSISVYINSPQIFGQTITGSILQISTSSSMSNPTNYNQSYGGTFIRTLSGLSRGVTYYFRCALIGSMTGQTEWSQVVQITIMSVAIGDSWLYTSGSSTFNIPASGTYKLEVCGGGGGGASSWFPAFLTYGGGGAGGYTQTSKYLYAGSSLNYSVGGGGGPATGNGWVGGGSGGTSQLTGSGVYLYGDGGGAGSSDVGGGYGGSGGGGSGGAVTNGGFGGSAAGLYNQYAGGGSSAASPYGKGGHSSWDGSWNVAGGNSGMVRITLTGV